MEIKSNIVVTIIFSIPITKLEKIITRASQIITPAAKPIPRYFFIIIAIISEPAVVPLPIMMMPIPVPVSIPPAAAAISILSEIKGVGCMIFKNTLITTRVYAVNISVRFSKKCQPITRSIALSTKFEFPVGICVR